MDEQEKQAVAVWAKVTWTTETTTKYIATVNLADAFGVEAIAPVAAARAAGRTATSLIQNLIWDSNALEDHVAGIESDDTEEELVCDERTIYEWYVIDAPGLLCAYCRKLTLPEDQASHGWHHPELGHVTNCKSCAGIVNCGRCGKEWDAAEHGPVTPEMCMECQDEMESFEHRIGALVGKVGPLVEAYNKAQAELNAEVTGVRDAGPGFYEARDDAARDVAEYMPELVKLLAGWAKPTA